MTHRLDFLIRSNAVQVQEQSSNRTTIRLLQKGVAMLNSLNGEDAVGLENERVL